jgi:hypothetical protein
MDLPATAWLLRFVREVLPMNPNSYADLTNALQDMGLTGQQKNPDQLIVSTQLGPVWPNRGNSFWLSLQNGTWYLSTWLPACYRIPAGEDVVALCAACMKSGAAAMYRVPDEIIGRFGLELISDDEFQSVFPESGDGGR